MVLNQPSDADDPGERRRRLSPVERRRARIAADIAKARRGDHTVPTWVLCLILLLMLGAWAALVILS